MMFITPALNKVLCVQKQVMLRLVILTDDESSRYRLSSFYLNES